MPETALASWAAEQPGLRAVDFLTDASASCYGPIVPALENWG